MTEPDQTECPSCDGMGGFESEIRCTMSCDWCGGCVDTYPCETCDGSGEVDAECIECGDAVVGGVCVWCSEQGEREESAA